MSYKLYGDGVHDDTLAIQAMLDTGARLVELPQAEVCYLVSEPLRLHSYQELRLPRYCTVRMADKANRRILTNADTEGGNHHITVSGGIWDCNNMGQTRNPLIFGGFDMPGCKDMGVIFSPDGCVYSEGRYDGVGMHFYNVEHLVLRDLTLKDPVTFACMLDRVSYFTVENIEFDFNHGNPYPANMDGIHCNGNCHFGTIRNLHGATYDDLVALNADEGSCGPISHILIDGVFAESCQSAIRLLTVSVPVEHITIRNVFGTCFMYGIGITNYYYNKPLDNAYFDNIVIENVHLAKGEPVVHPDYPRAGIERFGLIGVDKMTRTKSLHVTDLYRTEEVLATPTLEIEPGAVIEKLVMEHCACTDRTGKEYPFVLNGGQVGKAVLRNVTTNSGALWSGNAAEELHTEL